MRQTERESKLCATCGRSFTNRHRYGASWDEVRYCGERCRRHKPTAVDRAIEDMIVAKLRARTGPLNPSEVAREMFADSWEEQSERVRQAARRLVAGDVIEITQGGRAVDPSTARGAILLRLK
ncbi:MAG TPA: DUF3253 domain-containing protein [Polyangiales bacterium]|nr:DUF3253 domain-containing protein [Polyangiales bacterium]